MKVVLELRFKIYGITGTITYLYTHSIYGSVELKNENSQVNKIYEKGKNLKSTNKHEGHII